MVEYGREEIVNLLNEYIESKFEMKAETFRKKYVASNTMLVLTKVEHFLVNNPKHLPSVNGNAEKTGLQVVDTIFKKMVSDYEGY